MTIVPGFLLAGRYQLIEQLGAGAMGSVWRAEDRKLGAEVAIKLVDDRHAQSAETLARFRREAQVAAAIRSTYVVQILDYGTEDECGASFIAMELLQGETLASRLERERRLQPKHAVHVLGHVGRALSLAHEKGIVHRDLKPENVFLIQEGEEELAKVLDFGIARWREAVSDVSDIRTLAGILIGTPYYMSPEQATGRAADHQSDIWAYGAIAFECLTGLRPYHGESLGILFHEICVGEQPVPSECAEVPHGFDAWFARANARDKSRRFGSIKQAWEELRDLCSFESPMPESGLVLDETLDARVTVQRTARSPQGVENPDATTCHPSSSRITPLATVGPRYRDAWRSRWMTTTSLAFVGTIVMLGTLWAWSSGAQREQLERAGAAFETAPVKPQPSVAVRTSRAVSSVSATAVIPASSTSDRVRAISSRTTVTLVEPRREVRPNLGRAAPPAGSEQPPESPINFARARSSEGALGDRNAAGF